MIQTPETNPEKEGLSSATPAANLRRVQARIHAACEAFDRNPEDVQLLAVSKTRPITDISSVWHAGQVHFGENYLQEALDKVSGFETGGSLSRPLWHFIGAIQSNKTRAIAEHFDWVHTVSSLKVGRRLNDQRPAHLPRLNLLIQVNVDADPNKAGVTPDETSLLVEQLALLPRISLRGLMTLPEQRSDPAQQRLPFQHLAGLQAGIQQALGLKTFDQLSMGMSADLEAAVAEGATWVRIGTAIFGKRKP